MTDIATSQMLLATEVQRFSEEDEEFQLVALIKAMDFLKTYRTFYNEKQTIIRLRAGVQSYSVNGPAGLNLDGPPAPLDPSDLSDAIPADMLIPNLLQIRVGQTWYDPMQQVDHSQIRAWTHYEGSLGYPFVYAYWDKQLHFYTIPQDDFPLRLDYTRDLDRPRFQWNGSSWIFESRNSEGAWVALPSNYENEWLEHSEPLLRAWAKWDLYRSFYRDPMNAQAAKENFEEEMDRLDKEKSSREHGNLMQEASAL
jgi:hypothetical protein